MDHEIIKAIQVITIDEIEKVTYNQWYKHLCRWYSREFHTPLSEVLDMAEEYIIQTYYEDIFYKAKYSPNENAKTDWEELKYKIMLSDDEVEQIEESDDQFLKELEEKSNKIAKKAVKSTNNDQNVEDNPNLLIEESFQLSGEDVEQLPDFIGE